MSEAFAAAEPLLAEHAQIEAQLADPAVHADAGNARKLGRRYAEPGRWRRRTPPGRPRATTPMPPESWPRTTRASPPSCPRWSRPPQPPPRGCVRSSSRATRTTPAT